MFLKIVALLASLTFGPMSWLVLGCKSETILFLPGMLVIGFSCCFGTTTSLYITTYIIITAFEINGVRCFIPFSSTTSPYLQAVFRILCVSIMLLLMWYFSYNMNGCILSIRNELKSAESIAENIAESKYDFTINGWSDSDSFLIKTLLSAADNMKHVLDNQQQQQQQHPKKIKEYKNEKDSKSSTDAMNRSHGRATEQTPRSMDKTITPNHRRTKGSFSSLKELPNIALDESAIFTHIGQTDDSPSLKDVKEQQDNINKPFFAQHPSHINTTLSTLQLEAMRRSQSTHSDNQPKRQSSESSSWWKRSLSSRFGTGSQLSLEMANTNSNISEGLNWRTVTLMSIGCTRFNHFANGIGSKTMEMIVQTFTNLVYNITRRFQGQVHKTCSTRILCSWNAMTDNTSQSHNACQCALQLQQSWEDLLAQWSILIPEGTSSVEWRKRIRKLEINISIVRAEVLVGCIGAMKHYYTIGPALSFLHKLQDLNGILGTSILVCNSTEEVVRGGARFRVVDIISMNDEDTPKRIYECYGLPSIDDGEWMYTLMREEDEKMEFNYGQAFESYVEGKFDYAIKVLSSQTQIQKANPYCPNTMMSTSISRAMRRLYKSAMWFSQNTSSFTIPYSRKTHPCWETFPYEEDMLKDTTTTYMASPSNRSEHSLSNQT
eukprot:NODE_581_length_2575_cov_115.405791_g496_i0.p1 GENE.NODE_581_length_2575_cov_115.405791_g496_i0~~NODE_581_length_2575_cov_115.405791_g496_i0.p1  ORF type:complete len:662 (+),score=102.58 NODE_581_length_2575_cov_115.405791_g496_i0:268-2253(+)